jgi:hypothetical protein
MGLDLKGKQVEALRDALKSAFPTWDDLDMMVEFELSSRLDDLVGRGPMNVVTLNLVRWARTEGRLDDLLTGALRRKPGNQALKRFAYEISLSSDALPAGKLEAMVMPSVPFANAAEWRARMARAERCICRVEIPDGGGWRGLGTGFLVGPDMILTNAHVARDVRQYGGGSGRVQFDYAIDASGAEQGGRSCSFAASWSSAESPVVELDFALVQLAERAGDEALDGGASKREWLSLKSHTFTIGEPFFILQHPNAERLKLGVGAVSEIASSPPRVRYTSNTMPGSSGSPCFTMGWELVALHHAGEAATNRGIPMSAILEKLAAMGKLGLIGAAS